VKSKPLPKHLNKVYLAQEREAELAWLSEMTGMTPEEVEADLSRPDEGYEGEVPNAVTAQTFRDADAGRNLTRYASADAMFRSLGL